MPTFQRKTISHDKKKKKKFEKTDQNQCVIWQECWKYKTRNFLKIGFMALMEKAGNIQNKY